MNSTNTVVLKLGFCKVITTYGREPIAVLDAQNVIYFFELLTELLTCLSLLGTKRDANTYTLD